MTSLGELVKLGLDEMKKIWRYEEKDLTPWIAKNIDRLNKALGLQIEVESTEEAVQNFRADLVGRDSVLNMPVIIENQFGKSNHDHLGKLITYSADKEAGITIWIANEFQTAHSNAIEWLNDITPHDMRFYAVELSVYKIDDSKPAPDFRIVSGLPPSKRTLPPEISERGIRYQQFFEKLRNRVLSIQPDFASSKTSTRSYWSFNAFGISSVSMDFAFTGGKIFKTEAYIDSGKKELNDEIFEKLKEESKSIEEKFGQELVWDVIEGKRANRIYASIEGTIDDDEKRLNELIEWAVPIGIKFKEVFAPFVKNALSGE